MTTPPPLPPSPKKKFGSFVKTILFLVGGTIFGWLTDDTIKPYVVNAIETRAQSWVPWDSKFVQWIFPTVLTYESTGFSGCSGGELAQLVVQAEKQGLEFRDETQAANSRLCQSWTYHASAQGILKAMSIKFDNCFLVDNRRSPETFEIRLSDPHVCKTGYVLDKKTNNWVKGKDSYTLLCLPHAIKGAISPTEPNARECPPSDLIKLGFAQ